MAFRVDRVELYSDGIEKMMQLPVVREALRKQADAIANRGKSLAGSGEVADTIFAEDGTRPKGRPYSRAVSDPGRFSPRMPGKYDRRRMLTQAADIRY